MNRSQISRTVRHQCLRLLLFWHPCFDVDPLPLSSSVGGESGLRARERGGVVRDESAWGSYPYVSGGFPGRTSLSVCNCNYGRSRALCLIILLNVHLKQYLHMSVQFNIWVTPSSQLQNTPQHGSSGQPIMQHVTKVVGSILERRTIIKGKKSISQKHNLMRENAVTIQNVTFNHRYILISPRAHKSLKAQPLFIKDIQNEEDANCLFCIELLWINVVQSTLWTWVMHCAGPLKLRCLIGSRLSLLAGSSVNLLACVYKSKQMNHGTHSNSIYPLLPVSNNNRWVMTVGNRGNRIWSSEFYCYF